MPICVLQFLLGIWAFIFDSMLNFKNHINSVVKTCNYHIRNLYSVRKFLDQDCLITLVHSLIVSRVDYCNSLYLELPSYLLKKLQSIMNKSARLIYVTIHSLNT